MRRAGALVAQLAVRGAAVSRPVGETLIAGQEVARLGALDDAKFQGAFVRGLAGGEHHPPKETGEKNLLQKIAPAVIYSVPTAINAVVRASRSATLGLLTSGQAKSLVASVADNLVLSETLLKLEDTDVAAISWWLAAGGYTAHAGWKKLVTAAKATLPSLSTAQIGVLIESLSKAGYYDKELFDAVALIAKDKFTELDTETVLQLLHGFSSQGHYEEDLFDDLADSLTYCNHYLSTSKLPVAATANAFKAFADNKHDRADTFTFLARLINEDIILALPTEAEMRDVTMTLLRAFDALSYYPDVTEALLVIPERRPAAFSEQDKTEVLGYVKKVEDFSGGYLAWYRGGWRDPEHFSGYEFGNYNLWNFRDELVPDSYKPSDIKVWKT